MSMLHELLAIKTFRTDKAESAVGRQRVSVGVAEAHKLDTEQTLHRFVESARAHEQSLYGDLCTRVVKLRDIEIVQQEIVMLRNQEHRHRENLEKAEQARIAEHEALQVCRAQHAAAVRIKEKFVQLAGVYSQELAHEAERKEAAELDETNERRRERIDWNDGTGEDA
jgi:type III secretion protein O